nr:hypothetical protein GCM10020093_009800 [Planobispora longispora]
MTTGTLERLDALQVAAVLEHERAHLRHRHHLLLAVVDALGTALPWSRTVRRARAELPALVEMAADDAAARRHGPVPVIGALRLLAPAPLQPRDLGRTPVPGSGWNSGSPASSGGPAPAGHRRAPRPRCS